MKQQFIIAFVKIFPDHLIGARAFSTRTQHRALDCFISLNFLLAFCFGQDRNLNWGEVKITETNIKGKNLKPTYSSELNFYLGFLESVSTMLPNGPPS